MAPMASSDFEVKTCSKTRLKNNETLKKQYDDLRTELNKSQSDLANYKRALAFVEEQLAFYKQNEVTFTDKISVLKRDATFNEAENITLKTIIEKLKKEKENNLLNINNYDNATKSLFVPPSIDLSYSGIEKFKEPEFEGYGLRANKSVCKNSSNETKKNPDAPLIEEWVFDNEDEVESPVVVEKKTVVPTIPKVDVVRPKQQEKLVTKPVKYAEMYRQANTARPKAVVNAVRTNRLNVVKASTCWGNPETELEDLVRLNSPADKKRAGAKLTQQNDKSQYKK
ncbi:hypothetical protein Tco_1256661 [Tanacetum coccineum]